MPDSSFVFSSARVNCGIWLSRSFFFPGLCPADALAAPFQATTALRWGFRSAKSLIDKYISDPLLKAILVGQSGDHGLPPSMVSAPMHTGERSVAQPPLTMLPMGNAGDSRENFCHARNASLSLPSPSGRPVLPTMPRA